MRLDQKLCPPRMRERLEAYRDTGVPVGDFLQAVLSNDLTGAFMRADDENSEALGHIVAWVYENMPKNICGSRDAYLTHIATQYNLRVVDKLIDAIRLNCRPEASV